MDPIVETERLELHVVHPDFAKRMTDLALDTFDTLHPVMLWAEKRPTVETMSRLLENARSATYRNEGFETMIYLKSENKYIGMCGCGTARTPKVLTTPDAARVPWSFGYWVHKAYGGLGIVPEAVRGLMEFLHAERNVDSFVIYCFAHNAKSARVAEKLNFNYLGVCKFAPTTGRQDWPAVPVWKCFSYNYIDY